MLGKIEDRRSAALIAFTVQGEKAENTKCVNPGGAGVGRKARQGRQARWSGQGASLSPGCPEALEKGELLCTRGGGRLGVPKESR